MLIGVAWFLGASISGRAASALFIAFIVIFLSAAAAVFFERASTVKRLKALTQTARLITGGDLTKRAPVVSEDDIGVLAHSFNTMAESLINASEETKVIISAIPEPLFVVNPQGNVVSANLAASGMVWRTEKELLHKSIRDILGGALVRRTESPEAGSGGGYDLGIAVADAILASRTAIFDEAFIKRRIFEVTVTTLRNYRGKISGSIVMMHDITHRKEVDKMKSEFVSLASHQLKTPLTTINWFLEMLLAGDAGDLTDAQKEYAGEVYGASRRMARLVNDLLNVSRIDSGKLKIEPTPTQLEDFVQGIIGQVVPVGGESKCGVDFEKPPEKLPQVPVDQNLLGQVLQNLISNAVKYSPPGRCQIMIKLENRENHDYCLSVRDNGFGIPKDEQKRIFEKFYRASNAALANSDSTGLGLYIAKWIIEAAGGKIWFESEVDKGTTFYLTIPLTGMKKKETVLQFPS